MQSAQRDLPSLTENTVAPGTVLNLGASEPPSSRLPGIVLKQAAFGTVFRQLAAGTVIKQVAAGTTLKQVAPGTCESSPGEVGGDKGGKPAEDNIECTAQINVCKRKKKGNVCAKEKEGKRTQRI